MATFAQLKKGRKARTENLRTRIENEKSGSGGQSDDRFWKLTQDKAGNGYAIIRFLQPGPQDVEKEGENAPSYIKYFRHFFQVGSKWFVNNCPTTLGKECPVCEANTELWATEIKANRDLASSRKRQLKYVANILVVKDSANPENEGKVFLYEFGTKIYEKIEAAMFPEFEDEDQIDPFDFWEGADFKLKVTGKGRDTNYDRSEFAATAPIATSDKEIEAIWKQAHSLLDFISEDKFKDYDKLSTEFARATGAASQRTDTVADSDDQGDDTGARRTRRLPQAEPELDDNTELDAGDESSDDADIDHFQRMLDED